MALGMRIQLSLVTASWPRKTGVPCWFKNESEWNQRTGARTFCSEVRAVPTLAATTSICREKNGTINKQNMTRHFHVTLLPPMHAAESAPPPAHCNMTADDAGPLACCSPSNRTCMTARVSLLPERIEGLKKSPFPRPWRWGLDRTAQAAAPRRPEQGNRRARHTSRSVTARTPGCCQPWPRQCGRPVHVKRSLRSLSRNLETRHRNTADVKHRAGCWLGLFLGGSLTVHLHLLRRQACMLRVTGTHAFGSVLSRGSEA